MQTDTTLPFNNEVLLIDKPLNWTSFDVVNKIRYAGKFKKVGHAGTLDPLATGLLILCTGIKTKSIDTYQGQDKEYTGFFEIGKTTPSFDLETEVDGIFPIGHIDQEKLEEARLKFLGKISQIPPTFSAIKVNGKRAYQSAREGKEIELKARDVMIKEFEIFSDNFPSVGFRIVCSKGTYIRSLARDFGLALGSGGYLSQLRRTKIGDFSVENALSVNDMVELIKKHHENLP
jgi:tRNA pseudouridine55 synthase